MSKWPVILFWASVVVGHVLAIGTFDDLEEKGARCVIDILCKVRDITSLKGLYDLGDEEFQNVLLVWHKEITNFHYLNDDMVDYFSHFADAFCANTVEEQNIQAREYFRRVYAHYEDVCLDKTSVKCLEMAELFAKGNILVDSYVAKGECTYLYAPAGIPINFG